MLQRVLKSEAVRIAEGGGKSGLLTPSKRSADVASSRCCSKPRTGLPKTKFTWQNSISCCRRVQRKDSVKWKGEVEQGNITLWKAENLAPYLLRLRVFGGRLQAYVVKIRTTENRRSGDARDVLLGRHRNRRHHRRRGPIYAAVYNDALGAGRDRSPRLFVQSRYRGRSEPADKTGNDTEDC